MQRSQKLFATRWLIAASVALAAAWLLPNHAPPWVSFHGEAWAALVIGLVGAGVVCAATGGPRWSRLCFSASLCASIPFLQYATGQVHAFGTAWLYTLYILSFALSLRVGSVWEHHSPGQCADFVFLAIVVGGSISVFIQCYQWANFPPMGAWIMQMDAPGRFHANMAQPNQLASLLLLGVLGISWGFSRIRLHAGFVIAIAALLLFGVALTESRTAWLNVLALSALMARFHYLTPGRGYTRAILALFIFFVICSLAIPQVRQWFEPTQSAALSAGHRALVDHARLNGWAMLIEASWIHPWFGYGFGQIAEANYLVTTGHAGNFGLFLYSHNLFLDFILWGGYAFGAFMIGSVLWLIHNAWRGVRSLADLHLFGFFVVLGIHAMLEFPLHYTFFLLPTGLIGGAYLTKMAQQNSAEAISVFKRRKIVDMVLIFATILALTLTIRDYLRVETSFYGLRFESRNIPTDIPPTPPDVLTLTQLRDHIKFARNIPKTGITDDELRWMENTVLSAPSLLLMTKLAQNLAMNGKDDRARFWLRNICKTMPAPNCAIVRASWRDDPRTAGLSWPSDYDTD